MTMTTASDSRQNVLHSLEFVQISLRNAAQYTINYNTAYN